MSRQRENLQAKLKQAAEAEADNKRALAENRHLLAVCQRTLCPEEGSLLLAVARWPM